MQPGFTCGLFVTLVDDCNVNCSFCPFPDKEEFRNGMVLSYDKFMRVLDDVKNYPPSIPLGAVSFCGSGEPLMHKDIVRFVRETKKSVPQVSIVTNGLLLDESMASGLIATTVNHIVISITGDCADVYNAYQGNNQPLNKATEQFELVRNNVKRLVKLRNDLRSSTCIGISYILNDNSRQDLFPSLNYYHMIGVDYVDVRIWSDGFSLKKEDFREYLSENRQLFDANGGACTCFGKVMNLSTDGTLRFCNCSYHDETIIGNIFETPLAEILNTDKFKILLEAFHHDYDNIPDYCKICDLGRARPVLK